MTYFIQNDISQKQPHSLYPPTPRIRSCWGLSTAGVLQLLSLKTSDLSLGPTRRLKQGWGWHLLLHSVFISFRAAQTPAWLCTDMLMTKGCLATWPSSACFSAEDPKIPHHPKPWSPWIPERTKLPQNTPLYLTMRTTVHLGGEAAPGTEVTGTEVTILKELAHSLKWGSNKNFCPLPHSTEPELK